MTQRPPEAGTVGYGELPEFARALRALGSSRRSAGERQSHFFLALIDARRRAASVEDAGERVRAFDAMELTQALNRVIDKLVSDWPDKRSQARRALRAELAVRVEPYALALRTLATRAAEHDSAEEAARLSAWRAWTMQLAAVFEAADRAWMALSSAVDSLPERAR